MDNFEPVNYRCTACDFELEYQEPGRSLCVECTLEEAGQMAIYLEQLEPAQVKPVPDLAAVE